MAQIWIKGKPVQVETDEELLRLLPLADAAIPPARNALKQGKPESVVLLEVPRDSPVQEQNTYRGKLAEMDPKMQALLRFLARNPTKTVSGPDLRQHLNLDGRKLAGVISSFTKRYGKGSFVKVKAVREGRHGRAYLYRLSPGAIAMAKEEKWAG